MRAERIVVAALLTLGICLGGLAAHAGRTSAQDSMMPNGSVGGINSQTLTDLITSNGTTKVTLCPKNPDGSENLCPCITGNWINTSSATVRLTVRNMPRGTVVRTFLIPPTPANATMDSVQSMFGDGGGILTMETDAGGGTSLVFAGSSWYRLGGS